MFKGLGTYIKDFRSRSIGLIFVANAFIFGNWTVRIPDFKDLLQLSESKLGLALLFFPIGVILSAPFTAYLMKRLGNGKTTILFSFLTIIAFGLLSFTNNFYTFCGLLCYVGATIGSMDISMNGVTATVERELGRSIMATTHGFWSLGSFLGALFGAFTVSIDLNFKQHFVLVCLIVAILVTAVYRTIVQYKDFSDKKATYRLPDTITLVLIGIGFFCFIVEGGIGDWASLYFKDELLAPDSYIAFGYGGFSLAMAIMRFNGDQLINKFGNSPVLVGSGIISAIGLAVASYFTFYPLAILGMVITGLGAAAIIPIVFREASNNKNMRPETGLAMVTSFAYSGFLLGPPALGLIAEEYSIRLSFAFLGVMMAVIVIFGLTLALLKRG